MKDCLITFRSVTPAQRGEAVLRSAGIGCMLRRTPRFMQSQGCGYSVVLSFNHVYKSVEVLRRNQIPFQRIYLKQDGENYEELRL